MNSWDHCILIFLVASLHYAGTCGVNMIVARILYCLRAK